jgi:hypothetical protein
MDYVYKVLGTEVQCEDGIVANIALFAYKPWGYYSSDGYKNARLHFSTGAGTCDRNASKRTGWVVYGDKKEDGTIEIDSHAFKLRGGPKGSFRDGTAEDPDARPRDVLKVPKGVKIVDNSLESMG